MRSEGALLRKVVLFGHVLCALIFAFRNPASALGKREAYVSLLYDEPFVNATRVLFHSLRRTGTTKDFLVLVADVNGTNTLSERSLKQLHSLGCKVKHVRTIENPWQNVSKNLIRGVLQWQFTKLRIWEQTEYTKLVYMDSDMLVMRNIDELFNSPELSAADDYGFQATPHREFNAGLLVLEPSVAQLHRMRKAWLTTSRTTSMEQWFLNMYFRDYYKLPYIYNTPANVFLRNPKMWSRAIRVIHYTFGKPWEPKSSPLYLHGLQPVYDLWLKMRDELEQWQATYAPI